MAQSSYPSGTQTRTTSGMTGATSGTRTGMSDRASDTVRSGMHSAEQTANRMMQQGREVGEGMQEVAGNFRMAVDKSVREQPMATLAMAAVVGFVLGAIWKT